MDTEKASSDLESPATGRLKILVHAGMDVPLGTVIGTIEDDTQAEERPRDKAPRENWQVVNLSSEGAQGESEAEAGTGAGWPATRNGEEEAPDMALEDEASPGEQRATEPAEEKTGSKLLHRIDAPTETIELPEDLMEPHEEIFEGDDRPIRGITLDDTPAYDIPEPAATPPSEASAAGLARPETGRHERREPLSRLRKTLIRHLMQARQETAMLTTFNEADMSAVVALRERNQESFQKRHGVKLGFMSFFIKAAAEALRAFPIVNASLDGGEIVYHGYCDIGVAVSTERGLVVPVIRDADMKTFAQLEQELAGLAARARETKISLQELEGGTFSITNGGVFGSMLSTPLLNPPQSAILGMHAIEDRPVAVAGKVEIRPMMYMALSYDHRLIDGREAVQFLAAVKGYIAAPEKLLLGV